MDHHAPCGSLKAPRKPASTATPPAKEANSTVSRSQLGVRLKPARCPNPPSVLGRSLTNRRNHGVKISAARRTCSPAQPATPNRATLKATNDPAASIENVRSITLSERENSLLKAI